MQKKCKNCEKMFISNNSIKVHCSDDCRREYKNKLSISKRKNGYRLSQYNYTCVVCGITYHPKDKSRNTCCSRKCGAIYLSKKHKERGYKTNIIKILKEPIVSLIDILSKLIDCSFCGKKYIKTSNHKINYCSDDCKKEFYLQKRIDKRGIKEYKCKVCNKLFCTEYGNKNESFCSDKCKNIAYRINNKINKKNKKYKLKQALIDNDITLEKLMRRDKYICHICKKKVNINDFKITLEGYFITGALYPSIDHVIPISKGGKHSWDNIKLAHRDCNSKKSDLLIYEGLNGQMTLSV